MRDTSLYRIDSGVPMVFMHFTGAPLYTHYYYTVEVMTIGMYTWLMKMLQKNTIIDKNKLITIPWIFIQLQCLVYSINYHPLVLHMYM